MLVIWNLLFLVLWDSRVSGQVSPLCWIAYPVWKEPFATDYLKEDLMPFINVKILEGRTQRAENRSTSSPLSSAVWLSRPRR